MKKKKKEKPKLSKKDEKALLQIGSDLLLSGLFKTFITKDSNLEISNDNGIIEIKKIKKKKTKL